MGKRELSVWFSWISDQLLYSTDKQPTLAELSNCLLPALAPYWKDFCTAVNFDYDGTRLKIIDQTHRGNPEECCREVFMTWLKQERPTWQKVYDCLRKARCEQLARKVKLDQCTRIDSVEDSRIHLATSHLG